MNKQQELDFPFEIETKVEVRPRITYDYIITIDGGEFDLLDLFSFNGRI